MVLDQGVIQVKKVDENKYQMQIREQTYMSDTNPFRSDISDEQYKMANRKSKRKVSECDEANKFWFGSYNA